MPFEALAKKGLRTYDFPDWQTPDREAGCLEEKGGSVRYVYLLQSISQPDQHYVGMSDDLRTRIAAHNAGQSRHTAKFRPWRLVTYLAFTEVEKAVAFERYLKSGSGHAFARRRLW